MGSVITAEAKAILRETARTRRLRERQKAQARAKDLVGHAAVKITNNGTVPKAKGRERANKRTGRHMGREVGMGGRDKQAHFGNCVVPGIVYCALFAGLNANYWLVHDHQ